MAERLQLGSGEVFSLELELDQKPTGHLGLIWGRGRLCVNGVAVLSRDGDAVEWTWVDLLEWLAKNWAYLLCEQSFPFQVPATDISTLLRDFEKRWENMPEHRVEEEEEEVYRFLNRHDLSSAFKGLYFPATFLMRQGALMEVISAETNTTQRFDLNQAVAELQRIGDKLAALADTGAEGRGPMAAQLWGRREQVLKAKALPLLTGLPADVLAELSGSNDAEFWRQDKNDPLADSELMAAARMTTGVLLPAEQAQIIDAIRGLKKNRTEELDELASAFASQFSESGKPYDQGYLAAGWLREKLGLKESARVNPAELLQAWGIEIRQLDMPGSKLDALACWGKHHGPAILINKSEASTPAHVHGENTTLAHEICHLLMDRSGALPVAEVLNGNTPERLEKRARAFAAEFLLPRATAAAFVRNSSQLEGAVNTLSSAHSVSTELVCWQIINSAIYTTLTEAEQRWLQSSVRS